MKPSDHPICPQCAAIIPDDAPGGLCPLCTLEGAATVSNTLSGSRPFSSPAIEHIAPHFPDLDIQELLGVGGMGAVYKARQPQLDRFVALKILSHNLAGDPAFVERFNREARVLGRLSHPNIVGIHDFGTAGPYCYLLMEYVDGVNLRQAMRAGSFTPTEALEMVQHLCSALKFAHEEGILHRDIKPENILLDSKGRVKIADFGIAKLIGENRQHDYTLTMQGSILGSPHYMAPEQIETPGDVDQRADIYSLGVVFYELLTGGLPIGRFALPSEKASMDARIDHIVMRTLEKEREARYQSAAEVSSEVEAVTKHPASPSIKAAASQGEPVAARFSLTAAILTGISFPLIFVLLIMYFSNGGARTVEAVEPQKYFQFARMILVGLFTLCALGCALIGFILGARALGEIRRSRGIKTGVGSSIFATTAWPILFLFVVPFVLMRLLLNTSSAGRSQMLDIVAVLVWLLSAFAASWLLVWALYRWAKGAERKDGSRYQPGLALPLFMVVLLIFGGPLLMVVIANSSHSDNEVRGHYVTARDEPPMTASVSSSPASQSNPVDWYHGIPEVRILLVSNPEIEVEFQLIRSLTDSPDDNRLQTTKLGKITSHQAKGDWIRRPGSSNYEHKNGKMVAGFQPSYDTSILLGTTTSRKDGSGLTALCDWDKNSKVAIDMDFHDWQFTTDPPVKLVFSAYGVSEYVIATKDTGKPETAEQLVLRVVVTEADD